MADDDCDRDGDDTPPDRGDDPPEPDTGIISVDDVLDCLSDSRRRTLLYYLQDTEVAALEDVSKQVLAREEGIPPEDVPDDRLQRVQVQLVHQHLPKLAAAQLVEFDQRSQMIRYQHPPRLLEWILRFLATLEREE